MPLSGRPVSIIRLPESFPLRSLWRDALRHPQGHRRCRARYPALVLRVRPWRPHGQQYLDGPATARSGDRPGRRHAPLPLHGLPLGRERPDPAGDATAQQHHTGRPDRGIFSCHARGGKEGKTALILGLCRPGDIILSHGGCRKRLDPRISAAYRPLRVAPSSNGKFPYDATISTT